MTGGSENVLAANKICGNRSEKQKQEFPIPGSVKNAAGQNEHAVLPSMRKNEIEAVDKAKKDKKLQGIKKHKRIIFKIALFINSLTECFISRVEFIF